MLVLELPCDGLLFDFFVNAQFQDSRRFVIIRNNKNKKCASVNRSLFPIGLEVVVTTPKTVETTGTYVL